MPCTRKAARALRSSPLSWWYFIAILLPEAAAFPDILPPHLSLHPMLHLICESTPENTSNTLTAAMLPVSTVAPATPVPLASGTSVTGSSADSEPEPNALAPQPADDAATAQIPVENARNSVR